MAKPKRTGKALMWSGGAILCGWLVYSVASGGSQEEINPVKPAPLVNATPSQTLQMPTSTPIPPASPTISANTPLVSSADVQPRKTLPVDTGAKTSVATPAPQPTVREPNPPSNDYVPPTVKLTKPVSFPLYQKGVMTGLQAAPIGTEVKLIKINGTSLDVEYQGNQKAVPAASTDLLSRMLGTAD